MTVLYRIRDWEENFENNRTRDLKSMAWVPLPNKHDGDGYTELLDHPDGPAHYGAWVAIVQVASRCRPRGTLLRDGGKPHDSATLARMTRYPKDVIAAAITRLISIGWLDAEVIEEIEDRKIPHDGAGIPHDDAVSPHLPALKGMEGKEGNGREGNTPQPTKGGKPKRQFDESKISFPEELDKPESRNALNRWLTHKQSLGKAYKTTEGIDELLRQWARAGPMAFVSAVNHSIAQNYQGVYAPKESQNAKRTGPGQQYDPNASSADPNFGKF